MRKSISKGKRMSVYKRDSFICQYCGNRFSVEDLSIDHLIPLAKGGTDIMPNLITSCKKCNNKKGSK